MELSTFELLVKRIAPVPPTDATVSRRVVQGYFLTIANLEDQDLTYQLDFHISRPDPPRADRTLANNAVVFFDVAGANQRLPLEPASATVATTRFTTRFQLAAKQTASVQLLPDVTNPELLASDKPGLEVRGFVQLRLPALAGRFPFLPAPQSREPVKVLLNPEIRGTFLPNSYPEAGGDFDQINYPLELASGQGLNQIDPEPGRRLRIPRDRVAELVERLPLTERPSLDLERLDAEGRSEALIELLGQVDPTEENLETISDVLSKLEIPIQMNLAS